MKNFTWGAKLAGVPRDRLTSKLPGNHLLTTWKPPATYLKGFWIENITWGAKIAGVPRGVGLTLKYIAGVPRGVGLTISRAMGSQNSLGTQRS